MATRWIKIHDLEVERDEMLKRVTRMGGSCVSR